MKNQKNSKRAFTRREFIKVSTKGSAIIGLGSITLLGCTKKSPGREGLERELNLFNWRFYLGEQTIPMFEREFGVRVNLDYYASNDECLAKLRSTQGQYDLIIPSDYAVEMAIKEKLIQPIDRSKITNLQHIDVKYLNPDYDPNNHYSVPYMRGSTGFARNRNKVQDSVRTWDQMLREDYIGHISVLDDMRFTLGSVLMFLGYNASTTDINQLSAAKTYLISKRKLIRAFTPDSPKESLISGDFWLSYAWSGDVLQATIENPALEYQLPDDKALIFQDGMCIPVNAPHPNLAHAFMDYICRPDVSAEITNTIMYANPNKTARQLIAPAILSNQSIFPSDDYIAKCDRIRDVGNFLVEYDKTWNEIKNVS